MDEIFDQLALLLFLDGGLLRCLAAGQVTRYMSWRTPSPVYESPGAPLPTYRPLTLPVAAQPGCLAVRRPAELRPGARLARQFLAQDAPARAVAFTTTARLS